MIHSTQLKGSWHCAALIRSCLWHFGGMSHMDGAVCEAFQTVIFLKMTTRSYRLKLRFRYLLSHVSYLQFLYSGSLPSFEDVCSFPL